MSGEMERKNPAAASQTMDACADANAGEEKPKAANLAERRFPSDGSAASEAAAEPLKTRPDAPVDHAEKPSMRSGSLVSSSALAPSPARANEANAASPEMQEDAPVDCAGKLSMRSGSTVSRSALASSPVYANEANAALPERREDVPVDRAGKLSMRSGSSVSRSAMDPSPARANEANAASPETSEDAPVDCAGKPSMRSGSAVSRSALAPSPVRANEANAASPERREDAPVDRAGKLSMRSGSAVSRSTLAPSPVRANAASLERREDAPVDCAGKLSMRSGSAVSRSTLASSPARANEANAALPERREDAPVDRAGKPSMRSGSTVSRSAMASSPVRANEVNVASPERREDVSSTCVEKEIPAGHACSAPKSSANAAPEILLRPGERLDDLQWGGLRLIQRPDVFRFGTDSVLLADFAAPKRTDRAADLGCGTGAIATLMAAHCPGLRVDAVEIQPEIADMARRSVALNHMEEQICVHEGDLRDCWRELGAQSCTLVVCNPPYGRDGSALISRRETTRIARHEGGLSPEELARAAARLLRSGGRFCVVYPAPRAYEMMRAMDDCRLAPKRIRTVHGVAGRAPKLVLMDAVKDGGSQLHWLEPLVLQDANGEYTDEWRRIYRVGEHERRSDG